MRWTVSLLALTGFALVAASLACLAQQEMSPSDDDTAAPTPTRSGPVASVEFKTTDDLLGKVGEKVPGFGGMFFDPEDNNILYVYLLDPAEKEAAEEAMAEVFGPKLIPPGGIQVLQGQYSMAQLIEWYELMRDAVWSVPGVAGTDLHEGKNRIVIGMYPRRGAREEMEAALATLGIPSKAVIIEVECKGSGEGLPSPLADEQLLQSLRFRMEVKSEAGFGETVPLKLTVQNISDRPVELYLGGRPPYDFVVTGLDDAEVWHWLCGKIILTILDFKTLEPGEELEFTAEWEQVDNRGNPVPPGTYLLRGVLNMEPPEKLVTPAQALEVLR